MLFLLAALLACALEAQVLPLESQCARFGVAMNASLQLHWQLLSSGSGGPYTRISHSTVALSSPSRLLIIGGIEYESAQPVVVNTTIVYDPQADAFKLPVDQIASSATVINKDDMFISPASRVEHASVLVGPNVALLFGGQNAVFLNDLWRLCVASDSSQVKWDQLVVPSSDVISTSATPAARIGHSISMIYENSSFRGVAVYGGLLDSYEDISPHVSLALVARSSLEGACTDRSPRVYWRTLKITGVTVPDTRAYHVMAPVSKNFSSERVVCMLLYGGRSTRTNLIYGDVWRLCPSPGSVGGLESQPYQWEQLSPLGSRGPGPRYGASIVFVDEGKVAIAGGSYAFPNDFLSDLWEFNINATQWLTVRFDVDFTPPRRGHTITLLGDRLFLFGGRDRYSVVNHRMQSTTYAAPYCAVDLKITLCDITSTYVCIPCPAGYYLESGTRNCLPCNAGSFSAEGAAVCTKCPTGTYNTLPAQTSLSACKPCPKGSFSGVEGAAVATTCMPCAAGTLAASVGASACTSCKPGTFSSSNASSCTACGVGQWSATAAPQCSKCSTGSYNPTSGSPSCFPCPLGMFSDEGAANCSTCPPNTFSSTISTAGLAGCSACPARMFTGGDSGRSSCQYCSSRYTLGVDRLSCVPCSMGSFSGGSATDGGCVQCPLGSYADSLSSMMCQLCPTGTFTALTGSTSIRDCHPCSSPGQYFDGQTCRTCAPGSSLSTGIVPSCDKCSPGTYTSTSQEASTLSGCQICPTMSVAVSSGATACAACSDTAFAMAGWTTCIPCSSAFLAECPKGRNGYSCSGNGICRLRGCDCTKGWSGGDCSIPSTSTTTSVALSVLYFPTDQTRIIRTRSPLFPTFDIKIRRAGGLVGELRAKIQVKSSNMSTVPVLTPPVPVLVGEGSPETTLAFSISAFGANVVGSNCRALMLELVDIGDGSAVSAISSDPADRVMSLFFDDMNGPSSDGNPTGQLRTVMTQYRIPTAGVGTSEATANIDRVVATKIKLDPPPSTMLSNVALNVRVAIDTSGVDSKGIVDLLPAMMARIQMAYATASVIRVGLLNPDGNSASASVYQPISQFIASSKRILSTPTAINWQWIADNIIATNATQWKAEDGTMRRYVVMFAGIQSLPTDISMLVSALRQYAIVALIVLSPGITLGVAVPSDVMQLIPLTSIGDYPQQIAAALQSRDARAGMTAVARTMDSSGLVQSGTSVALAFGNLGLPSLEVILAPMQPNVSSSTLLISVPGYIALTLSLLEPGASCSALPSPESLVPADDDVLNGWIGAWRLMSDAQWSRQWKAQGNLTLRRYDDTSLLRNARTSVVAVTSRENVGRSVLQRILDGSLVAPGLDLVLKAYVRHTSPSAEGVVCAIELLLVPTDANLSVSQNQQQVTTRPDWTFVHFSTAVPFEVSSVQLQLDCNTTQSITTVEWTFVGLFPDPAIACLCPRGFFYDTGACVRCPAGSYCVAGIKRECPLGSFSFGKADYCERCRDGWICVGGLVRLCEAGTFASPDSSCMTCPSGYSCRNGKKAICPAGTFSLPQATDCQLCPPGTISTSPGSSSCSLCPLGSTSNYDRDHCAPCLAGETTTYPGEHPCSSCAVATFVSRVGEACPNVAM